MLDTFIQSSACHKLLVGKKMWKRWVVVLLATFGFLYQATDILQRFYKHATLTRLNVMQPKENFYPAITISLRFEKNEAFERYAQYNYDIPVEDLRDFITCELSVKETSELNCTAITKSVIRMDNRRLYFTFFERNASERESAKYIMPSSYLDKLVTLIINDSFVRRDNLSIEMQVHDPGLKSVVATRFNHFTLHKGMVNRMFYVDKVEIVYLPPPFATDCLDYVTIGFNSRRDCYETCVIQQANVTCKVLPNHIATLCVETCSLEDRNHICPQMEDIENLCNSLCKQDDCYQERYIILDHGPMLSTSDGFRILISPLIRTIGIRVTYLPLQTTMELLVYLGSTLSFWFGFSVLQFGLSITTIIFGSRKEKFSQQFGFVWNQIKQKPALVALGKVGGKRRTSVSQFMRIIIAVLSTLGLCYQSSTIVNDYLKYDITADFALEKNFLYLPGITVAIKNTDITVAKRYCGNDAPKECKESDEFKQFLTMLDDPKTSVRELNENLLNVEQIIVSCLVYGVGRTESQNCTNISPISRSFTPFASYHTFFSRPYIENYISKYAIQFKNTPEMLIDIQLNTRVGSPTVIFAIHQPSEESNVDEDSYVRLPTEGGTVQYYNYKISLLPKPYITNCLNYVKMYNASRRNLVHKCMIQETKRLCNAAPPIVTASPSNNLTRVIVTSHCFESNEIDRRCLGQYEKVDCDNAFYLIQSVSPIHSSDGRLILRVARPSRFASLKCIARPTLTLGSVAIYIGGCISLWFGINGISLLQALENGGLARFSAVKQYSSKVHHCLALVTSFLLYLIKFGLCSSSITLSILIFINYLHFETIDNLRVSFPRENHLPAFSVALFLKAHHSEIPFYKNETSCDKLIRCRILDSHLHLNWQKHCTLRYVQNSVRITFFKRNEKDEKDKAFLVNLDSEERTIFELDFLIDSTIVRELKVMFHGPSLSAEWSSVDAISVPFVEGNRVCVTYSVDSLQLLGPPYSDCQDYEKLGLTSAQHCWDKCTNGRGVVNCNTCQRKGCKRQVYYTVYVNQRRSTHQFFRICVTRPKGYLFKLTKSRARFTFGDVFVYVCNIVNLFLGFHFLLVLRVKHLCNHCYWSMQSKGREWTVTKVEPFRFTISKNSNSLKLRYHNAVSKIW